MDVSMLRYKKMKESRDKRLQRSSRRRETKARDVISMNASFTKEAMHNVVITWIYLEPFWVCMDSFLDKQSMLQQQKSSARN